MSRDVIALVVAIGFGIAVVVVGLRRDLSETTRSSLPRFGKAPERAIEMGIPSEGAGRGPLSPKLARWLAGLYLLIGLGNAVDALSSSDDRLMHAAVAAVVTVGAVALFLRNRSHSAGAPAS